MINSIALTPTPYATPPDGTRTGTVEPPPGTHRYRQQRWRTSLLAGGRPPTPGQWLRSEIEQVQATVCDPVLVAHAIGEARAVAGTGMNLHAVAAAAELLSVARLADATPAPGTGWYRQQHRWKPILAAARPHTPDQWLDVEIECLKSAVSDRRATVCDRVLAAQAIAEALAIAGDRTNPFATAAAAELLSITRLPDRPVRNSGLFASGGERRCAPAPGVVLTCGGNACRHTFEPDPVVFAAGELACPSCGGWVFVAELVEPGTAGGAS